MDVAAGMDCGRQAAARADVNVTAGIHRRRNLLNRKRTSINRPAGVDCSRKLALGREAPLEALDVVAVAPADLAHRPHHLELPA